MSAVYRPAVGIMLLNRDGLVFVAQRIGAGGEAWQMPQGGLEPGEDAQTGALRELEEETSIAPSLVEIITRAPSELFYDFPPELQRQLWRGRYRGQRQSWFLARFLGDDADVDLATQHPEFSAWRWVEASALPDLIVFFKRQLYREVLTAFEGHLRPGSDGR